MSKIEAIKKYFLSCPLIKDDSTIFTDYLPSEATQYSIYKAPDINGGVVKSFIGGDQLRSFTFVFAAVFDYGISNTKMNMVNTKYFEALEKWIESNRINNVLPEIKGAQSIKILQTGPLFDVNSNKTFTQYQMILQLIYYKEANYGRKKY